MNPRIETVLESCDIETFCSGGRGGQHVNRTESGVRLRHRPSGLSAICRDERSQHLNKIRCAEILLEKIRRAAYRAPKRLATRVPRKAKREKRKIKTRTSAIKQLRRRVALEE
ncbi:MAG: peptide chain release factor-like protein [Chitinispirillaceae bacterium]|nr:peptide chain release factor-like protein [Chitinispirillaceae bacterium]